jgi:hypothetical protein
MSEIYPKIPHALMRAQFYDEKFLTIHLKPVRILEPC